MAQSSENLGTSRDSYRIPLHQSVGDTLTLDVYIDHSLVEIYAGPYTVCSLRVYPTALADRIDLTASGDVRIGELLVREMTTNRS
jgi:hypothetical protein